MEIRKDDASSLKVGLLKLIHSDLALFSKLIYVQSCRI